MRKIITLVICLVALLGCSTNKLTIDDFGHNFKEENGTLEYTASTIDEMVVDATYLSELLEEQEDKNNKEYVSRALELLKVQLEQKSEELSETQKEAVENLNSIIEKLNKAAH